MLQRDSLGCKISFSLVRNMSITHDFFLLILPNCRRLKTYKKKKYGSKLNQVRLDPYYLLKI